MREDRIFKILSGLFCLVLLTSPLTYGATCATEMESLHSHLLDAELFLDDAIYLEKLVREFSPLTPSHDAYFARLNREVENPENLDLLKDTIGVYGFDLWVERLNHLGNTSQEFQKLAAKIQGREFEIKNSDIPRFKIIIEPSAQVILDEINRFPNSDLNKATYKVLKILQTDPDYQGLRTHIYRPAKKKFFVSYVSNGKTAHRIVWNYGADKTIQVYAILRHDESY